MNTRKSFETIHEDYRFFGSHSTEGTALREILLPILRERTKKKHVRWMDFGCGSGGFFGELLTALACPPADLDLALVDVDRGYLEEAGEKVAEFTASEVAVATSPEELEGMFDLITSKHALYYVKDLRSTVHTLCGMLKPGGLGIFMLGGKTNHLSGLWETAYAARNLPVPYFRAEDVALEIQATGLTHESLAVPSVVRFPDSRENRLKFLRFFFAGNTAGMTPESLLPLLDPLARDGDVVIESLCSVFLVSPN